MIMSGKMQLGTLVAFYTFLGALYLPLQRFSELLVIVSNSLAAIDRIFEFFDIEPDVADLPNAAALAVRNASVSFREIGFAYPARDEAESKPVLQGVDLNIEAGTI